MIGKPGGNLVRTYEWHIKALNEDKKNRFSVECIHNMKGNVDISKFDVFWFYAKAFHPDLYNPITLVLISERVKFSTINNLLSLSLVLSADLSADFFAFLFTL